MTIDQVRRWAAGHAAALRVINAEARAMSIEQRLHELSSLYETASAEGWTSGPEPEVESVRQAWAKLRQVYRARR